MGWDKTVRKFLILLSAILATVLAGSSTSTRSVGSRPLPSLLVDPNLAPLEVLGALPGLGPALSGRIVEAREILPFRSIDDLDQRVKGIGPAKAGAIRPYLRFVPNMTLRP